MSGEHESLSAAEYDTARRRVGEALASLPEPLRSEALAAYTIVRTEIGELAGSRRYLQRGWDEADLQRQDYETALRNWAAYEIDGRRMEVWWRAFDPRHIARAALEGVPVFPTSNQQNPPPQAEELEELLRAADAAASVAHDFIYDRNGVTREQASEAIWLIHNALRPLFEDDPEPGPVADIAAVLDRAQREHRATWKDVRRDR